MTKQEKRFAFYLAELAAWGPLRLKELDQALNETINDGGTQ